MLKKLILTIALFFIFLLAVYFINNPKVVGWDDFKSEMKTEFTDIKSIGVKHNTNPTIKIDVDLRKPFEKKEAEVMFLKVIDFLSNEESYKSLQDIHKERFKNNANRIAINFNFDNGENGILCSYEASSETGGDDFTFDSFKKWRVDYKGEYLGIYELP